MICINLIRVSADSKYLDINLEVTGPYTLDRLEITRFNGFEWERTKDATSFLRLVNRLDENGEPVPVYDDDGNIITDEFGNVVYEQIFSKEQVLRIPLDQLGGSGMFKVEMSQKLICDCDYEESCGPINAYVSDVSSVYKYLIGKLMNMSCSCYKLDEDLERAFMFLYAHQEAMQLNRISEAVKFYSALVKQFNLCGPSVRFGNDCVCKTPQSRQIQFKRTTPPGCGCGR